MQLAARVARIVMKLVQLIGLLILTRCLGPESAACILHMLDALRKQWFSLRARRRDISVETISSNEI